MRKDFIIFGDSHSEYFQGTFEEVNKYDASSAKGLNNNNSKSKTNEIIINKLKNIKDDSNIIFFFGKVDMDFILNYKYNTTNMNHVEFKKYLSNIVNSYINFIKANVGNKKIFVCELPILHLNSNEMLRVLKKEGHLNNINSNLSDVDKNKYSNYNKVIPYGTHLKYYNLFNNRLKILCRKNNFKFLEINKYFHNGDNNYKIPLKYKKKTINHHLNNNVIELYLRSLDDLK